MRGFKVPKGIFGCGLKHAPLMVYLYLLSRRSRDGVATATLGQIAERLELCPKTVSSAINTLEAAGYLGKGYKRRSGRVVCLRLTMPATACMKWVWVESCLFDLHLTPSQLTVYLYLKSRANLNGRAFPSLFQIYADTGLAKKTILAAIRALSMHSLLGRQHYVKQDRSLGHNNYTVMSCGQRESILCSLRKKKARTRKQRRRLIKKFHFTCSSYTHGDNCATGYQALSVKLLI